MSDIQDVTPTNETPSEQELNFVLTTTECNTILAGLEELPHKFSRKLIDKLISQAQSQIKTPNN